MTLEQQQQRISELQEWACKSSADPKGLLWSHLNQHIGQHKCNAMSDDFYYSNGRHAAMEAEIRLIQKAWETL